MTTWAIGDIHGCHRALDTLLAAIRPTPEDTIVVLGDVVDRGPNTRGVIETLLQLATLTRLVTLKGNHEEMLLDALSGGPWLESWLRYGGQSVLDSYGGDPTAIPESHFAFLRDSLDLWYTETTIFVHANIEPGVALDVQTPEWLRWRKLTGSEPVYADGYLVVCGHTPQPNGLPSAWPGWRAIDTQAYAGGWLTALDADSGRTLQSNEAGQAREGRLA